MPGEMIPISKCTPQMPHLWLTLLICLAAGCGQSGPDVAPVKGRVTLDGRPLATVDFSHWEPFSFLSGWVVIFPVFLIAGYFVFPFFFTFRFVFFSLFFTIPSPIYLNSFSRGSKFGCFVN